MTFENPTLLWLCLPIIALGVLVLRGMWRREAREKSSVRVRGSTSFLLIKSSLFFIALLFLIIALAGPKGNPHFSEAEVHLEEREKSIRSPIFLVIDDSRSMTTKDCVEGKSRLACAKELAEKVESHFAESYIALFGLDLELALLSPKTLDRLFVKMTLETLGPDTGGTPGTDYMAMVEGIAKEAEGVDPPPIVLFFSDGGDAIFEEAKEEGRLFRIKQLLASARKAPPIYTVAFGSHSGGPIPNFTFEGKEVVTRRLDEPLQAIAKASGGKFFIYGEGGNLEKSLFDGMETLFTKEKEDLRNRAQIHYTDYSAWPIFLASMALLLFWALPDTSHRRFLWPLLLSASLFSNEKEVEAVIQAEDCAGLEEALIGFAPQNEWQRGVLVLDRAICAEISGEKEKALEVLEGLLLTDVSDKELWQLYLNLVARALDDPWLALELARTVGDRALESEIIQSAPPQKEGILASLAIALEWEKRVELAAKDKELIPFFEEEEHSDKLDGKSLLAQAFINFHQKDLAESKVLFERAEKELLHEAKESPKAALFPYLVSNLALSLYDIEAVSKIIAISDTTKAYFEKGNRVLFHRSLLMDLLNAMKETPYDKNPIVFLETMVFQYESLLSLLRIQRFFHAESEIAGYLPQPEEGVLQFWKAVLEYQKKQYVKKGLCFTWEKAALAMSEIPPLQHRLVHTLENKEESASIQTAKEILRRLKEALAILRSKEQEKRQNEFHQESEAMQNFQDLQTMDRDLFQKKPQEGHGGHPW